MRRYNIVVSGILLIFSINGFALAAPILLQEKHQARVDVVHIPKESDVITVVENRGKGGLEKPEEYLNSMRNPFEASDGHASSSSAPPGSDHGPTNVVQAPAPMQGSWGNRFNVAWG